MRVVLVLCIACLSIASARADKLQSVTLSPEEYAGLLNEIAKLVPPLQFLTDKQAQAQAQATAAKKEIIPDKQ